MLEVSVNGDTRFHSMTSEQSTPGSSTRWLLRIGLIAALAGLVGWGC